LQTLDTYESNLRYYPRNLPAPFASSAGSTIVDDHGTEYLDFFAGAGVGSVPSDPSSIKCEPIRMAPNRYATSSATRRKWSRSERLRTWRYSRVAPASAKV
jgi:acetylornithine/succinyldiaminopimelate/putrescine aminotransferase